MWPVDTSAFGIIVGDRGTVLRYSTATGQVDTLETPFDDWSVRERPDLRGAWGDHSTDYFVLGDGAFYRYSHLSSSHPDYDPTDNSPKW